MDNLTVGMENLPNVFIDKIILSPGPYGQLEYRIKLCMYDHRPERSWYQRDDLLGLRVKVALVSVGSVIAGLNSGQDSLDNYGAGEFVQIIDTSDFGLELEGSMQDFSKFTKIVTFKSSGIFDNLNVYAACFNDFGPNFDLGNKLFNKFYGPMTAEKIFVGGQQNQLSGYFYYPDSNKEYGGPVHLHPGRGYMEGSMHKDQPHSALEYVAEENNKLVVPMVGGSSESVFSDFLQQMGGTSGAMLSSEGFATGTTYDPTLEDPLDGQTAPGGSVVDPSQELAADTVNPAVVSGDATVASARNQTFAQDLLADVSFEIRDAIRRGRSY